MKEVVIRMKGEDAAEVLLYDIIGGGGFFDDGITAKAFREQIMAVKARTLCLRINSPGGSVTEASAMLAALDQWKGKDRRVECDVDGIAASAASFVMMGADTIRTASNALIMVHDPFTMCAGGAEEMRRTAELLDKVRVQILDAYCRRKGVDREVMSKAMADETWFTGAEAVAAGLADSAGAPVQVAAFAGCKDVLAKFGYRHVPDLPSEAEAWAATNERRALVALLVKG